MLAAPMPGNNDHMMHEAVTVAAKRGLLQPNDHVVCVMSIKDSLVVKVVTMDNLGTRAMRHTDSAAGSITFAFVYNVVYFCSNKRCLLRDFIAVQPGGMPGV